MSKHERMELLSTVTSKGQTTIPKELRSALGITDGTPLRWTLENGVLTVKAKTKRIEDFVPMVPPNGARISVDDMNRAVGKAVAARMRRSSSQ